MNDNRLRLPILLSIAAALLTMALKGTAWWLTGSVGLLSDAAESLVNLAAALVAYFALVYSSRPVDRDHTYGHEKIEFFSSGLEGILIFLAALAIGWSAIDRLVVGAKPHDLEIGLALSLTAALVNLAVARILLRVGRECNSIVLEADGQHLMTDVWTSAGVLIGLLIVRLTGLDWLDPVVALAVALHILVTAWHLVRRSFDGLMDRALPDDEVKRLRDVIGKHLGAGMTFHALRTRKAGARSFADFHLLVPGEMTVAAAHDVADRIESALEREAGVLEVTIHVEPVEAASAWQDSALLRVEERG
jgi:cation diffusion facilitator family transporter